MRRSREDAARTRARAVRAAARLFRARGVEAVGPRQVMQAIGMTHGGFYRHFRSKAELVAEAIGAAAARSSAVQRSVSLEAFIDGYLSAEHVGSVAAGCPVAALVSEARRQPSAPRGAFTRAIAGFVAQLEGALPASPRRRSDALALFAVLVGAVALARASADPELAGQILAAARVSARRMVQRLRGAERRR
jgi:TetR/AcrR family transcriptional repressor of nem operon